MRLRPGFFRDFLILIFDLIVIMSVRAMAAAASSDES
jgi:hypothetical protein